MRNFDYLVYDDIAKKPEAKALFDRAVEQLSGANPPEVVDTEYPVTFVVDGQNLLATSVLKHRLRGESIADFQLQSVRDFVEKMRRLLGWNEIDSPLHSWVDEHLRDPFFVDLSSDFLERQWVRRSDAAPVTLSDDALRFACDVAIGDLKYGPSYACVNAEHIFDWVTQLGSDLPAQLKKHGTGNLPSALAQWKAPGVTATANDAVAVIRITQSKESEQVYGLVLDYLLQLLVTTDFPRSYSIEYRGPSKTYLPIKGLPKKGVHQLFACAATYPALWEKIEAYARAAIREFEWYNNMGPENCLMPGSFAVFALALADPGFAPLVLHYLKTVDGEHQSMHGNLVEACIDAQGFTETSIAYLMACAGNIQDLRHRKSYPALMNNAQSLTLLLQARDQHKDAEPSAIASLRANLEHQSEAEAAFKETRSIIWGKSGNQDNGRKLIASASADLRPLYEGIFA